MDKLLMYDKHAEENKAIAEANALRRQGRRANTNENRVRQQTDTYSQEQFEKFFKN